MPNAGPWTGPREGQATSAMQTVQCPGCDTTYRVPSARAFSVKLRCGQCKHAWTMPADDENGPLAWQAPDAATTSDDVLMESDGLGHGFATDVDPTTHDASEDPPEDAFEDAPPTAEAISMEPEDAPDTGAAADDETTADAGTVEADGTFEAVADDGPDGSDDATEDMAMDAAEEANDALDPQAAIDALMAEDVPDEDDALEEVISEEDLEIAASAFAEEGDRDASSQAQEIDENDAGSIETDTTALADEGPDGADDVPLSAQDDIDALMMAEDADADEPDAADEPNLAAEAFDDDVPGEPAPIEALADEPVQAIADEAPEDAVDDRPAQRMDVHTFETLALGQPRRRRRLGRMERLAIRAAAGLVLTAGIVTALYGISARETIVASQPRMASLYDAIGLPVNLSPFTLSARDARLAAQASEPHLSLTISLRNGTSRPQPLPAMNLILRDHAGNEIDRRAVRVPTERVLGLDTASFKTRIDLPAGNNNDRIYDAVITLASEPAQRAALARLRPLSASQSEASR